MQLQPTRPTGKGPADCFSGDVYVDQHSDGSDPSRLVAASVHFTPGAHTHWHRHGNGQTLVCLEGQGLVGTRDGQVIVLEPGDTVVCPANEDHWHGAAADRFMLHLALLVAPDEGDATVWLESVAESDYAAAQPKRRA